MPIRQRSLNQGPDIHKVPEVPKKGPDSENPLVYSLQVYCLGLATLVILSMATAALLRETT